MKKKLKYKELVRTIFPKSFLKKEPSKKIKFIKYKNTYILFKKINIEKTYKQKDKIIIPARLLKIFQVDSSGKYGGIEIIFSETTGKVRRISEWSQNKKKTLYVNKLSEELDKLEKLENKKCLIFNKNKSDFRNFEYCSVTRSKDIYDYGELLIFENEKFFNLFFIDKEGLRYLF